MTQPTTRRSSSLFVVSSLLVAVLAVPSLGAFGRQGQREANPPRFLAGSALDTEFEGPGEQAVALAAGLTAEPAAVDIASWADMIAPWPNEQNPTHLFVSIEQRADAYPTAEEREQVQLVELATGEVTTVLYGLTSADGIRVTPWGTVLITEEESDGQAYEIFDPLAVKEAFVDRVAHTSEHPDVIFRPALGTFAWEGIAILPDGTLYAGDELRPQGDVDGGAMFKFVPATPLAEGASVSTPEESPFAAGTLHALSLGGSGVDAARDYGQGTQTGRGIWIALDDPTQARAQAAEVGATGYYRPEDIVLDTLALAKGVVRIYWTNTGNDGAGYYGEVMSLIDGNKGKTPNVQYFVIGDGAITQPDNIAIHPTTGHVYIIEDFSHGDIWVCKKDGGDPGSLSDGCGRFLSVRDPKSEPTGFILVGDGDTAYLNLQHRVGTVGESEGRQTDDLLKITGLNQLLP